MKLNKIICIIFCLLFNKFSFAQFSNKIYYDFFYENSEVYKNKKSFLYASEKESIFILEDKVLDKKTLKLTEDSQIIGDTINNIEEIYKNLEQSMIYSKSTVKFTKQKTIVDKVSSFNWELIPNETKKILGYSCKKAKINFRGREYYAYYSEEIKLNDGPWKFNNLPGLILEIIEKDNLLIIKATKIEKGNFNYNLALKLDNAVSFDDVVEEGKVIYKKTKKELEEKYNGTVNIDFSNTLEKHDLN